MACMPSKCCFCVPLRPGLLTWAYIKLILAVASIAWSFYMTWRVAEHHIADSTYLLAIHIGPLTVYIVFTIVLIISLHYENYKLLLAFLVSSFFEVIVSIVMLVMRVVNVVQMGYRDPVLARYYWSQTSSYLSIIIPVVVNILLPIYFIFVIISELAKIKAQENQSKKAVEETRVVLDTPIAKKQDERFDFVYSNPEEVLRKPLFPVNELQRLREQLGVQKV